MKAVKICLNAFLLLIFIYGCATAPKTPVMEKSEVSKDPVEVITEITPERDKENKSLDIFAEILDLVESTDDRQTVLPGIEDLYSRIIREYPETPLAQESYWKLITICLEDYSPPKLDKADALYKEFINKYPESLLRVIVEDTLGKGFYKNAAWSKLINLYSSSYNEYIEKGKKPRASSIFMYSEANFYLENMDAASKGYEIVAELFPQLREGKKSKAMLEKMKE